MTALFSWTLMVYAYYAYNARSKVRSSDRFVSELYVLFISYKFVKGFLAITFFISTYLLLKLSWCVSTFFIYPETKFSWIWQKMRNFPIDPIIKIAHFCNVMSIDVTKLGDFYNGGLWEKSLSFVGSSWNPVIYILFLVI